MSEESPTSATSNPLSDASGENLVSLGALLVAASWLAFEVIAEEYFVTTVAVALALIILVVPRIDADAITDIASIPVFIRAAGYTLAAIGVVEIVDDVQAGIFDADGATIFGAIVAYAGYVLAFFGARKA